MNPIFERKNKIDFFIHSFSAPEDSYISTQSLQNRFENTSLYTNGHAGIHFELNSLWFNIQMLVLYFISLN